MRLLNPSGGADSEDKSLLFTLQSTCKAAGVTSLTITLRTFEMTQGQRSKDIVEFTVRRVCAGAFGPGPDVSKADPLTLPSADAAAPLERSSVESTPIPGFDVAFAAARGKGQKVVEHGQPKPQFKPREGAEKGGDSQHVVSDKRSREDLVLTYTGDKALHVKKPLVVVEQPSVFTVTESLGALGHVKSGLSRRFSLSFNCLSGGRSEFTVIFTFADDAASQVSFRHGEGVQRHQPRGRRGRRPR